MKPTKKPDPILTIQEIEAGLLLYHGSGVLFDTLDRYESRFSPELAIPLAYATKTAYLNPLNLGYLYEYQVIRKIPYVLHSDGSFLEKDAQLMRNALANTLRYADRAKPMDDLGVRNSWDDLVGEACEYSGISGFSMLKNEKQIMLCKDAIRNNLVRRRVFTVEKHNTRRLVGTILHEAVIYTLKQISPKNGKDLLICFSKGFEGYGNKLPELVTRPKSTRKKKSINKTRALVLLRRRIRGDLSL